MAQPTDKSDKQSAKFILTFAAGINENQTPDISEASSGYNFDLSAKQTKLIPRAPFDLKGTTPNAAKVTGIMQLVKRDATQTTLVTAGTTTYKWNGASTFSSVGTVTADALFRDTYWSLGDYSVITDINLLNVVKKWDGTTFSNMTTGLGAVAFYAKYSVVFLNRIWYFNVVAGTTTPHMIVASTFEDPTVINVTNRGGPSTVGGGTFTTGLEPFYLLTPDLKPINGVALFQNILVISTTDGKLFKLTGTSSKDFLFVEFYVGSSAAGNESIQNIGNDVIYVRKGGNVNLLSSTQQYGDVLSHDISRWIPTTVNNLPGALIVYDQSNQKVFLFIANKVLVLFKDILFAGNDAVNQGFSPWSFYTTFHPNYFNSSAAKYMYKPGTTNYSVYWGDSSGNIFDMNGTGSAGDAGAYVIDCKRKSRLIDQQIINPFPYNESNLLGRIQFRRKAANSNLDISFEWEDEYTTSTSTLILKGPPANDPSSYWNKASSWGGGSYWSQGSKFVNVISHQTFSPTGKGSGFYITLQNQSTSAWQVDHLELY